MVVVQVTPVNDQVSEASPSRIQNLIFSIADILQLSLVLSPVTMVIKFINYVPPTNGVLTNPL